MEATTSTTTIENVTTMTETTTGTSLPLHQLVEKTNRKNGNDILLSKQQVLHDLTTEQIIPLALIPIPGSILSFFSSILIIRSIRRTQKRRTPTPSSPNHRYAMQQQLRRQSRQHRQHNNQNEQQRRNKKLGPYERIMLAMSCCDLLYSAAFIWSPFMTPSGYWWPTPNHFGTRNTCRFIGTIVQLSLSNILYFGWLGVYFMLSIRFHVRQETFARRIEPWVHGVTISFSVVTSLAGGIVDFYDELALFPGCWIDNYPKNCTEDCKSPMIAWICAGIPTCIVIVSLIVNYFTISFYVSKRYGRHRPVTAASTSTTPGWGLSAHSRDYMTRPSSAVRQNSFDEGSSRFFISGDHNRSTDDNFRISSNHSCDSRPSISNDDDEQQEHHHHQQQQQQQQQRWCLRWISSQHHPPSIPPTHRSSSSSTRPSGGRHGAPTERRASFSLHPIGQANRVRLVSTQAYLYIGSFFLTYSWFFLLQIVESMSDEVISSFPTYPFMILQALFTPLAGFWNALVFFRPKYIALRQFHVRRYERQKQRRQRQLQHQSESSSDSPSDPETGDEIRMLSRWMIFRLVVFGENNRPRTSVQGLQPSAQTASAGESNSWYQRGTSCITQCFGLSILCHSAHPLRISEESRANNSKKSSNDNELDQKRQVVISERSANKEKVDEILLSSRDDGFPSVDDDSELKGEEIQVGEHDVEDKKPDRLLSSSSMIDA